MDYLKFSNEFYNSLSRKHVWESVFRIRLSMGFRAGEALGNIQIKQKTQDLVLAPTMDSDRVIMYEFERTKDDTNQDQSGRLNRISKKFLFVQSALLYSSSEGQRRIRCHNMAIPLTTSVNEAFEFIDVVTISALLARKALNRFDRMANVEATRSVIEASMNNMCKANHRTARLEKGEQFQFSENMEYLIIYILGLLKSQIISIPPIMNQIDTVDKLVYTKFQVNHMSPDEVLALFNPQIICVSDRQLNDQEYPPLEALERTSIRPDGIYLLYNSISIYMYIGRQADPFFFFELFQATDFNQINKAMSEDAMFAQAEESQYLKALQSII